MLPSLRAQGGLDTIGIRHEDLGARLQVQQYEFVIEFESKGVAERGFDREPANLVRRPAQAPQFERRESQRVIRM